MKGEQVRDYMLESKREKDRKRKCVEENELLSDISDLTCVDYLTTIKRTLGSKVRSTVLSSPVGAAKSRFQTSSSSS